MAIVLTEEMFKAGKPVAQGEVFLWMKKYAPTGVLKAVGEKFTEMKINKGPLILGHSETGHHHVLEVMQPEGKIAAPPISKAVTALISDASDVWMELKLAHQCQLKHLRDNDTHEALILPEGEYIRGLREEQSPEGWQRAID